MIRLKESELLLCCGSTEWAKQMAAHSFPNVKEVFATGDSIWWSLGPPEWREAFAAHPKIGARETGEKTIHQWSREEQAAARHGSEQTQAELRSLNREYEEKFGFLFIICATGKSAHAILESLRERMSNDVETEVKLAAEEQRQITHLRLKRLLAPYK